MIEIRSLDEQLVFNLNRKGGSGLENFYISQSNELALGTIKNWTEWPEKKCLLIGPTGGGKSHLAHFWAEKTGAKKITADDIIKLNLIDLSHHRALLIDDVDKILSGNVNHTNLLEENLLHLLNSVSQCKCLLMMTSTKNSPLWNIQLPDLISRLKAIVVAELLPPDDELLVAVMLKQFDDKQIKVTPDFVLFVSKRIDRSFEAVAEFVNSIDQLTLRQKRNVTIPIASKVLDSLQTDRRTDSSEDHSNIDVIRSNLVG